VSARVLLVTGSRALTDTPQAEEWARTELAKRIGPATLDKVIAGDARGPDEWAHEAAPVGIWRSRWCLDGTVRYGLGASDWTEARWLHGDAPRPSSHDAWAQRALARNRAMVEHTARRPEGVRVLALLAPWSRTRGTQHTMRLAREHSLPVEVLACPEALGPRGGR